MMISQEQLQAGMEMQLKMILPETSFDKKAITFKVNSRWSKLDVNPAFYASGHEFSEIGPIEIETIASLIDNFAFKGS
jgi:hypothetical protein